MNAEDLARSKEMHHQADALVAAHKSVAPQCWSCGCKIFPIDSIFAKRRECRSCFIEADGPYNNEKEQD